MLRPEEWTYQEHWVWEKIKREEIADFNIKEGVCILDLSEDDLITKSRIIRSEFLETILLEKDFVKNIPRRGVYIFGAWVKNPLDLSHGTIFYPLNLDRTRFEADVDLMDMQAHSFLSFEGSIFKGQLNMHRIYVKHDLFLQNGSRFRDINLANAKIESALSLVGSTVEEKLDMNGLHVGSDLFMRGGTKLKEVILIGAKIEDQVDMNGVMVEGILNMDKLQVGSSLFMSEGASFQNVILRSAKIAGQVAMTGCTVKGNLDMNGLHVGTNLFMREGSEFNDVTLVGAKIYGQVDMTDVTINGTLNMDSLIIKDSLYMRGGAIFNENVKLTYAVIAKNLQLYGSTCHSINLQGTLIKGDFDIGPPRVKWKPMVIWDPDFKPGIVRFDLNSAHVGVLRDVQDAWPVMLDKVELDGFVYDRWGGYSGEDAGGFHTRPVEWFKDWLKKDTRYCPQPYEQLAKVLKESGHPEKAKKILYASKEEERKGTEGRLRKSWLWLMKWTVGYGYKPSRLFLWTLSFVTLGFVILETTGQCSEYDMLGKFWYSLDTFIPFVKLNLEHYSEKLCSFAKQYFYVHQLVGYILITTLIAGVKNLLKI